MSVATTSASGVASKTTSADGTTIAYDRCGHGPALILVGGAFQYRAFDPRTAEMARLLSCDYTVVHYDRRGRGESGDTTPYSIQREIEDIAALIAAVGGSAFVCGMSSGAALALDAVERGLPITKLAVYEPAFVVGSHRPPVPVYIGQLDELIAQGKRDEAVELFLTKGAGVPREVVTAMRQSPVWPGFVAVAHTLPYDARLVETVTTGGPLPTDRWSHVTVPTLVVDGGASEAWIGSAAQALAQLLPGARRLTLPGQAHGVEPEAMVPVLKEFFVK